MTINKTKKRKRNSIVLIIVSILIISIFGVLLYNSIENNLYKERKNQLATIIESSSKVVSSEISKFKQYGNIATHFLYEHQYSDAIEAATNIADVLSVDNLSVFLIDSEGKYYNSNGSSGRVTSLSYYTKDTPDQVIYISDNGNNADGSNLVVRNRLDEPIVFGEERNEIEVLYCAVMYPLKEIKKLVTTNLSITFNAMIIDTTTGQMLYHNYDAEQIYEGTNAYTKLKAGNYFHGENADDLLNRIKKGETVVAEFKRPIDNKRFFEALANIDGIDWTLCFTMTTASLSGIGEYDVTIVIQIVGLGIGLLLLLAMIVINFFRNRESEKEAMIAKERADFAEEVAKVSQSASQAKTDFLSHMSHDIRTPINGIMGMTAIAKNNINNPQKIAECLNKIDSSSHHLLSLINDVLDMSRIDSGKVEITPKPAYLENVLNNCASIIEGQIINRDLEFVTDFVLRKEALLVDELHLRQIIINILGNAIKFTPEGGKVTFKAREVDNNEDYSTIQLEFEDNGIGMKKEFLDHIFESFTQENDSSRTNYQGTGLGMTITKKYVDLMNGDIKVESEYGKGSKFTVTLPFEHTEEIPEDNEHYGDIVSINGIRILLVEDNQLNREIIEEMLQEEHAEVTSCTNGKEAVEMFASKPRGTFDIILMDVMMPVMNGHEATRAIRNMARADAKMIPIIALTANAFDEDIKKCKEAGMNAHLAKPLVIKDMLRIISNYMKGGK